MHRLVLFCLLLFVAETALFTEGRAMPADTVYVVFTANTNGQLLDCGCETGLAGGLPRRRTIIDSLKDKYPDLLLVDGGDLFATNDRQWQNWTMMANYRKLGYDVVAVGDQEFWNGLDFFLVKAAESKLPFVFSNAKAPFPGCITQFFQEKGNTAVQVLAVLDSSAFGFFPKERLPKITFERPEQTLRRMLDKGADLRIVIFHGEAFRLKALAEKVPDADLWLLPHHQQRLSEHWTELHRPPVVTSEADGESIVLLRLFRENEKAFWRVVARRIPLRESILPDSAMMKSIQEYYLDLQRNLSGADSRPYRSENACRHCHLLAYEAWTKSPHFSARNDEKKVACSQCHTLSERHGEWGFEDKPAVAKARSCERCHTKKEITYSRDWNRIKH